MSLPNRWAAEAMIASYNHVYKVVYGSTYADLGAVRVTDYGQADIGAAFQIEFLALESEPSAVVKAVRAYPKLPGEQHALDVFHATPEVLDLRAAYAKFGYEYRDTIPILAIDLPAPLEAPDLCVQKVTSVEQAAFANTALAVEEETIHAQTLGDLHIHNFTAEVEGQLAGWAQMVTVNPAAAYVNQMFTLTPYRRRGVASALLNRIHGEASALGFKYVVLIPSEMARRLYHQHGHRPQLYFSVFRPRSDPCPKNVMS